MNDYNIRRNLQQTEFHSVTGFIIKQDNNIICVVETLYQLKSTLNLTQNQYNYLRTLLKKTRGTFSYKEYNINPILLVKGERKVIKKDMSHLQQYYFKSKKK